MAITVESLARMPDCAIMAAPRLPGRVACPACSTCPFLTPTPFGQSSEPGTLSVHYGVDKGP